MHVQGVSDTVRSDPKLALLPTDLRALVSALDGVTDSVELLDPEGRYTHVNVAWSRLTGNDVGEAIGSMAPALLQGAQHDPAFVSRVDAAITKGESWEGEMEGPKEGGSTFASHTTITPIHDDAGRLGHILVIRRDLAPQREADRRVLESDSRFQRAVYGAHDGLWELDLVRKQLHLSPRCRELAGVGGGEIDVETGKAAVHPDDLEVLASAFARHVEGDEEHMVCEVRLAAHG